VGAGLDGPVCLHHWHDRIRACGNGVVPDQAELAFRVLWGRMFGGRMNAIDCRVLDAGEGA
jgi:hypothetical protein